MLIADRLCPHLAVLWQDFKKYKTNGEKNG